MAVLKKRQKPQRTPAERLQHTVRLHAGAAQQLAFWPYLLPLSLSTFSLFLILFA